MLCVCFTRALLSRATKRVKSCFKIRIVSNSKLSSHKTQKGEGGIGKRIKKRSGALKNINSRQESFHLSLFNSARARMFLKISITTVCKLCLSLSLSHSRACFFRRTSIPALFILRHSPRASSSSSSSRQIKVFSFSFWLRRERGGEAFSVSIAFA